MKVVYVLVLLIGILFTGCDDAQIASANLSKAADNFELNRRIIFYNSMTGEYMLVVEGKCSQEPLSGRIAITCKTGENEYKKHFLGLNDNVTYFSEQLESTNVSTYHYRVTFKPQTILPDIDFKGSEKELIKSIKSDKKD